MQWGVHSVSDEKEINAIHGPYNNKNIQLIYALFLRHNLPI